MGYFVVAEFQLTSASRGPSVIAELLVHFGCPIHISGMAEARALKFSTDVDYIKFCQRDDKSLLKGAWFSSRDQFYMGNCGLRNILHCTEARAVSCDKQFAANRLLLIASTALILGLRFIGLTCHRMCCKVGCITYRQQVD